MQPTTWYHRDIMEIVSILTRPEGRMQRSIVLIGVRIHGFQSSPGQKAGCNPESARQHGRLYAFQSSPGQKAGCNDP